MRGEMLGMSDNWLFSFVWTDGSACCGSLSIREEVYALFCCGYKGNVVDVEYIHVCRESVLLHDRQF